MKTLSTTRDLTMTNKGIQSYTFETKDFYRFTISKYDGKWEMQVEWIFRDQPQYGGMFYFDTLKDAKTFAASSYKASMA